MSKRCKDVRHIFGISARYAPFHLAPYAYPLASARMRSPSHPLLSPGAAILPSARPTCPHPVRRPGRCDGPRQSGARPPVLPVHPHPSDSISSTRRNRRDSGGHMESAYASTFLTSLEPVQAATILRDRVASNRAIAEDLAEWFREYQTIEQGYCRSLGKLASRLPTMDISHMGYNSSQHARYDRANRLSE